MIYQAYIWFQFHPMIPSSKATIMKLTSLFAIANLWREKIGGKMSNNTWPVFQGCEWVLEIGERGVIRPFTSRSERSPEIGRLPGIYSSTFMILIGDKDDKEPHADFQKS